MTGRARVWQRALTALAAAAVLAVGAPPAEANHASVSGRITDAVTGQPLDHVCVTVGPPIQCWTETNSVGEFKVTFPTAVADGQVWEFNFLRTGYATRQVFIVVNGPTPLNVTLSPHSPGAPAPEAMGPAWVAEFPPPDPPGADACGASDARVATTTVYMPNITKMLGGRDGWQTPFIVQNVGAANADLEVSFYGFTSGKCVLRLRRAALAPGTSQAYSPNAIGSLPADRQFSVVVRSFGSSIVGVVNEHNATESPTRAEALSYDGTSEGATSVFLPNIVRRFYGYVTPFIIQNLGTDWTTVRARFVPFDGSVPEVTVLRSIAPGRSKFVDPNSDDETVGAPGLVDGKQYAVTLVATQPIAAVVNTHNDAPTVAAPVAYSTNGLSRGAASVYGAYAAKNADGIGRVSTIVVQNLGTTAVTPTLTFTPLGGGATQSFTSPTPVPAGGAWAFDPRFFLGTTTPCNAPSATCLGDGEYTFVASGSGATLAAAVNVISPATAMGYTANPTPSQRVFLPNVTRTLGGSAGWTTPILLQTVTANGATVRWYRFSDGALVHTQTLTIASGSGVRIDPRALTQLADDTQYAVVVDGAGGTVSAVVVELASGADNAMIYEGFAAPGTTP